MSAEDYIPELGDWITLERGASGTTTGRITYRSRELIRVVPTNDSTRCVDFPLDPETGTFEEGLRVSALLVHEKRTDPHFALQLGVGIGERIECFDHEGHLLPELGGTVVDILVDEQYDAIVLETTAGQTVLDFGFVGPQPPDTYPVLRARSAPELAVEAEDDSATAGVKKPAVRTKGEKTKREKSRPIAIASAGVEERKAGDSGDEGADDEGAEEEGADADDEEEEEEEDSRPLALIEFVEEKDQTFSDSIQREDMFNSLLLDVPTHLQRDPAMIQATYRTTDLLLHMKRSVVQVDETGTVIVGAPPISHVATTVQEALQKRKHGEPLASVLPVAAIKRVLYVDSKHAFAGEYNDVTVRSDHTAAIEFASAPTKYSEEAMGQKKFAQYMRASMQAVRPFVPMPAAGDQRVTRVDQDVLRSRLPPAQVQGFDRGLPQARARGDKGYVPLTPEFIGDRKSGMVRLLSATRVQLKSTEPSILVAPPDTAETVGHVLLPPQLSIRRLPLRSSVLLWDIQASDRSRSESYAKQALLESAEQDPRVYLPPDGPQRPLVPELEQRIRPMLSFWNRSTALSLDSLGLRDLELTETLFAPFARSMTAAQAAWRASYAVLTEKANQREQTPSSPAIESVAAMGAGLFAAVGVLDDETFQKVFRRIAQKESTLHEYDLALATRILSEAGTTLGPFWYALAGGALAEHVAAAESNFLAESRREHRNRIVQYSLAKEFTAKPSINRCRHVNRFERIFAVRNDMKRMKLFKQFLKEYQGGNDGNWKRCNRCADHLVCKHEVLLLHEFQEPERSAVLHKTLLMEYASPHVFQGAFICKNCGQKIQELEYDNSIEFDAEGRPLVGRSEGVDEEDDLGLREEGQAYKGENLELYNDFQSLFYTSGVPTTEDTFRRVVAAANECFRSAIQDADKYAKTKPVVPYAVYVASNRVAIMGALLLLELQTAEKPVTEPFAGCPFSAAGFPLEADRPAEGVTALSYVSCLVSNVNADKAPWNSAAWSKTSGSKRLQFVTAYVSNGVYSTLGLYGPRDPAGSRPPIPGVSDLYKARLDAKRLQRRQEQVEAPVVLDKLPPAFRPLPVITRVAETAIGNQATLEANLEREAVTVTGPVVLQRQRELAQNIVGDFHEAALGDKNRSDASCCAQPLSELSRGFGLLSMGYAQPRLKEIALQDRAVTLVNRKDPVASGGGTHLYVPWSSPRLMEQTASADDKVYYMLFLKNCFRGRNKGLPHEFGDTFVCRHCEFALPEELMYLTASEFPVDMKSSTRAAALQAQQERRIALANEAFATAGLEINEESFRALELLIRERRAILPRPPLLPRSLLSVLQSFTPSPPPLLPHCVAAWGLFVDALTEIHAPGFPPADRLPRMGPFNREYGITVVALKARMVECLGDPTAVRRTDAFWANVTNVTSASAAGVSLRTLNDRLATAGRQVAHGSSRAESDLVVHMNKWVPGLSASHSQDLRAIWKEQSACVRNTLVEFQELSDPAQPVCKTVLERFSDWYGAWNRRWSAEFRPGAELTESEYTNAVSFAAAAGMLALLTPASPFYAGVLGGGAQEEDVASVCRLLARWLLETFAYANTQTSKYHMTREQIDAVIQRAAEKERKRFIKEFDDLSPELRKLEKTKERLKIGRWQGGVDLEADRAAQRLQEAQEAQQEGAIFANENDHRAGQDEDD